MVKKHLRCVLVSLRLHSCLITLHNLKVKYQNSSYELAVTIIHFCLLW